MSSTKSDRVRGVELDPRTIAVLRAHRARQLEERLAIGAGYTDNDLIFARLDGSPISPEAFSLAFKRRVMAAGLPMVRLHDLRHGWATMALQAGVPAKVVSDRLGHSGVGITLDVYSHATPSMQMDAAAKVSALVFGA